MVIKASASAEIRQLVAALGGEDDVRREAAIARLAIIGPRAVDALHKAYAGASSRDTKIAVLRALEPLADRRTIPIAAEAIRAGADLARTAVAALRALLDSSQEPASTESLDVLIASALDVTLDRHARLAAVDALQGMPAGVRARISDALRADPDATIKKRAGNLPQEAAAADAVWQDALEGRLPDSPASLRDAAASRVASAALGSLQKLIDALSAREAVETSGPKVAEWRAIRGALHQALALRGSRVAVYDLREAIERARSPLPTSFLAALHVVGDQSCLEPLAAAFAASAADPRWRVQVGAAFRAIARREKISQRHALAKRIAARWADALPELYGVNVKARGGERLSG
jgi:hypothetical protein